MIRVDALWLCAQPTDMRAGADKLLIRVVSVFGRVQPHHGYLFANKRGTRIELLVHDGIGVWLAARRLYGGHKRWRYGQRSEQLDSAQRSLLDEEVDADLVAIEAELDALRSNPVSIRPKNQPKREPLPPHLLRVPIVHEPESDHCACGCQLKRIGEDIAEKLDYTPGVFTVERHIRGKWACPQCQRITMAPMPAQVIDKGLATAGTLAHVLVAKFSDHLPLHRQEGIFARAGLPIAWSTLAQWVGICGQQLLPLAEALQRAITNRPILHADETPIGMLSPGKGKTHKAYLWAYAPSQFDSLKAVVYDFAEGRSGKYPRQWLGDWRGTLLCDDYTGYKALFAAGVTEAGCMAHARRKFHDLHVDHQSEVGEQGLRWFGKLYDIEREIADSKPSECLAARQTRAGPIVNLMHQWLMTQRRQVPDGTVTAPGY